MKMSRSVTQGFLVAGSLLLAIGLLSGTVLADDDDDDNDKDKVKIVKCDKGKTIAKALKKGNKRKPLVIIVRGTCKENVLITRDDVTLRGDKDVGGTVEAANPDVDTILIRGARRVVIDYLTVSGGRNGVNGVGGADFTIQDSIIQENIGDGVRVAGSSAVIINNKILDNGEEGVNVVDSANARIGLTRENESGPNTIAGNAQEGIQISNSSAGIMFGNDVTENGIPNRLPGIGCFRSVCRLVGANDIHGNFRGVMINDNGALFQGQADLPIAPNRDTIRENINDGIIGINNASVRILDGAITDNGRHGILLDLHSTLRIRKSDIMGNSGNGIQLSRDSGLSLENPVVRVTGNGTGPFGGFGILCIDSESSFTGNISGVTGNNPPDPMLADVNCTDFNQAGVFPPPPAFP